MKICWSPIRREEAECRDLRLAAFITGTGAWTAKPIQQTRRLARREPGRSSWRRWRRNPAWHGSGAADRLGHAEGSWARPDGRSRQHVNIALHPLRGGKCAALVLAGGLASGAFEGCAYVVLEDAVFCTSLEWVAGSSLGAVKAAIIAGDAPADSIVRLRQFSRPASSDLTPVAPRAGSGLRRTGCGGRPIIRRAWRRRCCRNGRACSGCALYPGPRAGVSDVSALFDLSPPHAQFAALVDFDRLNGGDMRVRIAATDMVGGESHRWPPKSPLPLSMSGTTRLCRKITESPRFGKAPLRQISFARVSHEAAHSNELSMA